ncbi:MAG: hypothetical protein V2A71_01170 [Candidatus Eisenbacteria bacterium]
MDLGTLAKAAVELGVIPALALFLVFAMHLQNRKLTSMLEKQEQNTMEILKILVQEVAEFRRIQLRKGSTDEAHN